MHLNINKIIALFISSILLLVITGCGELSGLDSNSKVSRFTKSERTYKASLRWGEWIGAIQLHRSPEDKQIKPFSDEYLEYLSTIKIKNIEAQNSGMNPDKETGQTLYIIEFRFDNSAKINKIRHMVHWWYDKKSNTWFTKTPLPKEFDLPEKKTIKLSPKNN